MQIVVEEISNVIKIVEETVSIIAPSDDTVTVITAGTQGAPGIPGAPGVSATAGADERFEAATLLSGHKAVVLDALGKAIYATADNPAHAGRVVGVTLNAANVGNQVTVRVVGKITESGWNWIPEKPIFLGLNGQLTQTPPLLGIGFSQSIAMAVTTTSIIVQLSTPILVS